MMLRFIEALINPFALILIFLTLLLLWYRKKLPGFFAETTGILITLLWIISSGFPAYWLNNYLENQYAPLKSVDKNISLIVVLGGGKGELVQTALAYNKLSAASIKRLLEGVYLYRQIPNANLIVSGGNDEQDQTESRLLEALALWFSVPANKLILESTSHNTAEQARLIKLSLINTNQPFYLVTSAAHMPRAMRLFKAQGLNPIASPTDFTLYWKNNKIIKLAIPNGQNIVYLSIAMHELLGYAWAKLI